MQTAVLNTAAAEAARAVSGSGFVGEDDSVARRQLAEMQLQTELAKRNNALTAKAVTTAQQGNQIAVKKSKDDLRNDYYIQQLTDQTKRFTNSTSNFIFDAMKRTLGPFGFGAARNALEGPGELGNLIGGRLNITKKITPFLQNIVGKRAGSEYAQIFGQIGNVFIDKFANQVGKGLGFTDTDQFGFGQILSNLMTGGTKEQKKAGRRMGLEQLLYNFTGIPTGSSTLLPFLNKQFPSLFNLAGMQAGPGGLFSPEQLMRGLANYGGQMVGGPFTQGVFGAFNGMNNGLNRVVSYDGLKVPLRDANVLTVQEGFTYDSWETATNQQEGFFNQLGTGLTKVFTNVGDGLETVLGNLLGGGVGGLGTILTSGFNLLASLFGSGGLGGGGTGLGGGGGFFEDLGKAWSGEMSWGDALLNTGMKFGGNLLTNYAAYALTKNIDNPYVRLAAQQGANYLIKSGLQVGAGALGYGDVASKFLGKDTGLTTAFKTGDFSNLNPFKTGGPSGYGPGEVGLAGPGTNITMPGSTGISTAYNDFGNLSTATTDLTGYIEPGTTSIFGNASGLLSGVDAADVAMSAVLESGGALSSAGAAAASVGDAAALGMDAAATAGTSVLGDLAASAGEILPYAGAIIKLFQGDIVGAAGSALGGYLGTFLTPWLGPLGPIVGSFLGSFLGGGKADPRVTWAIYVNGNNDPTAGGIISEGKKTPQQMRDAAQKIGIMLFAMAKKVQLTLGGGPLAYDYFALELHGKA
ncbi:MAG: hypothetical protein EBX50_18015, partial [Chitinophagia bacterium]|nr:hypothetical protein [Chitinophagia bacterium]